MARKPLSPESPADAPAGYRFSPIGIIRSCYTGRFGIPRQPGLVTAATAQLELFPAYGRDEAFAGLAGFSHVWVVFVFHDCLGTAWKPTVRPPRLGGRRKVGVFASRAPYRPNPIGLSAVELIGLERRNGRLCLRMRGADLLDGTPVLDIKPYLPYADALADAKAGYAPDPPGKDWRVELAPRAREQLMEADPRGELDLSRLIRQVLRQDPRPGYMDRYPERTDFGMRLYGLEVRWRIAGDHLLVTSAAPAAE
jgi:tRNA-Thr(GGU) m(6)t(6)A37 methyltransferase TsaA